MDVAEQEVMAREPATLATDPFSESVLLDPYPFFDELRAAGPVAYLAAWDIYAVGNHAEAEIVASDYERFHSRAGMAMADIRRPDAWRTPSPISEVDPPEHTAIRRAMNRILSPAVLRGWKQAFAEEAEALVARVVSRDEFDGVRDLVEPFVASVFPSVLGVKIPAEAFLLVGQMNFNQMGPNNERTKASVAAAEPWFEQYEAAFQREGAIPGGFAEKIFEAEDAGDLPAGIAAPLVRSFIRGGVDTTIAGLGFTFNQLAQNPDQYAIVHRDPSRSMAAFEEAIRHEAPAQVVFRTVKEDIVLNGVRLKGDRKIGYFMGAANRDAAKFEDPDRYRIERMSAGAHLALGRGVHVCVGQQIARLEADCLVGAFARRVAGFEPAGAPLYRPTNALRTLESLPLRITVRP
ncbi:cytochrome P450 [Sphingopyxis sp.]|uniref:cytochrome P450 n=1 Tax=Sphingopyxis sp. TaxID=1908224 RepID=UPI002D786B98|nr:cytochrome P450 [Sphingopyxis sp.]HET6526355.1 cytochrome P450 [Sphingopyxis sp.]